MSNFNIDLATEVLLFSVDALFSVIALKSYNKIHRYINSLQEVITNGANINLENVPPGKTEYVMIHGSVHALGNTIPSVHVPNTRGVVQKLSTNELVSVRKSSGLWRDETRQIHQSLNTVPFAIIVGKYMIQVQDVELAYELHLDTVFNNYEPTSVSLAGSLWGFFCGVRRYGVQTTEEMLKEGAAVTGIGDLMNCVDGSKQLIPPAGDKPYFITTHSLSTLISDLRDKQFLYGTLAVIFGGITVFFGSLLLSRLWTNLRKRREKKETQRRLEENRRLRQQNRQNNDVPEHLQCVVCLDSPREVILLPCGHLCVCEECSGRLNHTCPVCRNHVTSINAAFLS